MANLSTNLPFTQLITRWAAQLNPILKNPTVNNLLLKNVQLSTGVNVVNHRLGRELKGWKPTRIRSAATFYDQQDTNQTPELTLVLVSSADVVIDLEVF